MNNNEYWTISDTGIEKKIIGSENNNECNRNEKINTNRPIILKRKNEELKNIYHCSQPERKIIRSREIEDYNSASKSIYPGEDYLVEKTETNIRNREHKNVEILRLRGGGLTEKSQPFRLRAGAPSKSPIAECQEVMEQFDKVLEEYRKALAPCGQLACNYAPNITEATCKTACGVKPETGMNTAGCGFPECQYAKYKSALMAMDYDIERQFIGPAILGNCGHPKCSYQSEPILPPIHWDCPDPLPVGKCKNPNCPYAPHMGNRSRVAATKGPCGSDQCPYAPPAPCSSPNCPFRNLPACASAKQSAMDKKGTEKSKQDAICSNCPFANPPTIVNMMQICDNPDCDIFKKKTPSGDCGTRSQICENPNCPYKGVNDKCSNPECPFARSEVDNACSNPDCPLKQDISSSCSNPNCPFAKSPVQVSSAICSNPNCPLAKSPAITSSESCSNPNCPFGKSSPSESSSCSNPDCPNKKPAEKPEEPVKEPCANPECPFNKPSLEVCQNPECPFLKEESEESSTDSCDNPECPYKKGSKTSAESDSECECDNPTCPSKKETCINPNCPFNLRGYDPCTNPDCPYKKYAIGKDLGFCATPDPSFNEWCADKTCPFHDPKKGAQGDAATAGMSLMKIGSKTIEEGLVEVTTGDRPSHYDMAPCTIKTCKFMGGLLKCVDCAVGTDGKRRGPCPKTCPGDPICPLASAKKSKKAPRRKDPSFKRTCIKKKKFMLDYAERYPGYRIGHRECVMPYFFVPPKMGWLWNIHTPCMNLKPRRGWRPGAITRAVARLINKHKKAERLNPHEERRKKKRKDDGSEGDMICPKPTLEIKKREGQYFITMNPLKDPNILEMNENPYLDCTPLQFRVAKNDLFDPDIVCADEGEAYKYDSSSNSELDIEITTPAGIIHTDRPVRRKDVKVKQTQYSTRDLPPPPEKAKGKEKEPKEKGSKDKGKGKKGKK